MAKGLFIYENTVNRAHIWILKDDYSCCHGTGAQIGQKGQKTRAR